MDESEEAREELIRQLAESKGSTWRRSRKARHLAHEDV